MVPILTGSAPFIAVRRQDRSTWVRSSSRTLRTARSYPKFGATVYAEPVALIVCSHIAGLRMKTCGARRCTLTPAHIPWQTRPIKPMSWYSGKHPVMDSPCWDRYDSVMTCTLCERLALLIITPFGFDVEPEVYCSSARSSGPHSTFVDPMLSLIHI